MIRYKALFTNRYIFVNAEVLNCYLDPILEDGLVLRINEINIEIDGFEVLFIEEAKQCGEQELQIFEYEIAHPYKGKQKKDLYLKNFHLETIIPIQVLNKNSNDTQTEDLHVHVFCDENRRYKYHFKIMNKTSELSDFTDALREIQFQLRHTFGLKICAVCKNSCWNPYGGVPFFNHLCFKADKESFWALKDYDKHTIGSFMDDAKWQHTYVTYRCEKFLPYY